MSARLTTFAAIGWVSGFAWGGACGCTSTDDLIAEFRPPQIPILSAPNAHQGDAASPPLLGVPEAGAPTPPDATAEPLCTIPMGSRLDTVSLFEFEDAEGSTKLADSIGDHFADVLGGNPLFVAGPNDCGQAFAFGTTTLHLAIDYSPDWELDQGSVDFLFRVPDEVPEPVGLLGRDASGTDNPGHMSFWLSTELTIVARLQTDQGDSVRCSETPLQNGAWVHVGFNFGPPTTQLFIDGVLVNRPGAPGVPTIIPDCATETTAGMRGNPQPWVLGYDSSRSMSPLNDLLWHFDGGAIDAFRVSRVRRDFSERAR